MAPEYGYVIAVFVLMFFVYQWMAMQVVNARRTYKVAYPALYAPDSNPNAKQFNCVQRGHQNSLENLPFFIAFLLLGGLHYPIISAIGGFIIVLGRISYFAGYATGDPKKRYNGTYQYVGLLVLIGTTIASAVAFVKGS